MTCYEPYPYLTPNEKLQHLDYLEQVRANHRDADDVGPGKYDPEVTELVDGLNALYGVCTTQSCCGHPEGNDRGREAGSAHLWLRLSKGIYRQFNKRIGDLLDDNTVHMTVDTLFRQFAPPAVQRIVSIRWEGYEVSEEQYLMGAIRILRFFQSIRRPRSLR